ncbi:MAG: hypothetical protein JXR77_12455 [Lentisphaeria bacterium]|nr:hypothetical protein [Lentisphaeria bacterium]
MPVVSRLGEWFQSLREIFAVQAVGEGFLCGLAVGLILPIGAFLVVWLLLKRRKRCRFICVPSEGGNLTLSAVAMREFLQRIVAEFRELELLGVALYQCKRQTDIHVRVNVTPEASIRVVKDALKERVRTETSDKMGLDELLGDVHVDVLRYSASERRIARKADRALGHARSREASEAAPLEEAAPLPEEEAAAGGLPHPDTGSEGGEELVPLRGQDNP